MSLTLAKTSLSDRAIAGALLSDYPRDCGYAFRFLVSLCVSGGAARPPVPSSLVNVFFVLAVSSPDDN